MPCPYKIILGWDTALPSPLYYSGATGIEIILDILGNNKTPLEQVEQGGLDA